MPKPETNSAPGVPGPIPDLEPDMFRVALEAAPTPMIVVREDGSMILVNQAAGQLLGYEAREMLDRSVEMLLPEGLQSVHEQHRAEFLADASGRPMGSQRDLYAIRRDGSAIPIEIGLSPVATSAGLATICTIVDLTGRKEEEEDLLRLAARLSRKNERLLELVSTDSFLLEESGSLHGPSRGSNRDIRSAYQAPFRADPRH